MIRTVCMFYNYDKIEIGDQTAAFFRLAGVYVTERFYSLDKKIRSNLKELIDQGANAKENDEYINSYEYNYSVYFLSDEKDEEFYVNELQNCNQCRTIIAIDGYETHWTKAYSHATLSNIIRCIINSMYNDNVISSEEYKDLQYLLRVYLQDNIYLLLVQTSYLYPFVCKDMADGLIGQYNNIVDKLIEYLNIWDISDWGDDLHRVIQYSILKLAVESNIYSKRSDTQYIYDSYELLNNCNKLIKSDDFGYSFALLAGEINTYILNNNNKAYSYYIDICKREDAFNAYAYYLKGQYWKEFGLDIDTAIKYFQKSIKIYPLYYRAWYMLGCMYIKLDQIDNALKAFETVKQIIMPRYNRDVMRPREYDCLCKSCRYIAEIYREKNMDDIALKELMFAEALWNHINMGDNKYFSQINISQSAINSIKKGLGISQVYGQIIDIYYKAGMAKEGNYYMDLLKKQK